MDILVVITAAATGLLVFGGLTYGLWARAEAQINATFAPAPPKPPEGEELMVELRQILYLYGPTNVEEILFRSKVELEESDVNAALKAMIEVGDVGWIETTSEYELLEHR